MNDLEASPAVYDIDFLKVRGGALTRRWGTDKDRGRVSQGHAGRVRG